MRTPYSVRSNPRALGGCCGCGVGAVRGAPVVVVVLRGDADGEGFGVGFCVCARAVEQAGQSAKAVMAAMIK
jgi:hypothetical protein